jgi:hypothetical protein
MIGNSALWTVKTLQIEKRISHVASWLNAQRTNWL